MWGTDELPGLEKPGTPEKGGTFITILQNVPGHMTVTMEDPSRGQAPPHILCYSSYLKHLMSVSDAAS